MQFPKEFPLGPDDLDGLADAAYGDRALELRPLAEVAAAANRSMSVSPEQAAEQLLALLR